MGTKNDPGGYDCYAKAEPDEPIFTLRAKDPSAPYLVRLWALSRRQGAENQALQLVKAMFNDHAVQARASSDSFEKLDEALACSRDMVNWRYRYEHEQASGQIQTHGDSAGGRSDSGDQGGASDKADTA